MYLDQREEQISLELVAVATKREYYPGYRERTGGEVEVLSTSHDSAGFRRGIWLISQLY